MNIQLQKQDIDQKASVAVPKGISAARGDAIERPVLKTYDRLRLGEIPQLKKLPPEIAAGIDLVARVLPFKVNQYVINNLIDWKAAPDDPIFRLNFPMLDMIAPEDAHQLSTLLSEKASEATFDALVDQLRMKMNPHPADQRLNSPFLDDSLLSGVQHKYTETVLFFPKQGQTCHAYCTFCFRWPQFIQGSSLKFEASDAEQLHSYLRQHEEVTDLLLTGGDPMVMNTRRLQQYLQPFVDGDLQHVQTIRIGTKALTYWPHRFLTDPDSDDLIKLFRDLRDAGRNVALMAHINHWREIEPEPAQMAVHRLKQAGVVIRSQAPVLQHINDDAEIWRRNWLDQTRLGIVPYYMFLERDTGPKHYFQVPIARALQIHRDATSQVSGISRTARGPTMSTSPGKVEVVGTIELAGEKYFILTFAQARNTDWLRKPFLAKYSETACWLDHLEPPNGESAFFFARQYEELMAGKARKLEQTHEPGKDRRMPLLVSGNDGMSQIFTEADTAAVAANTP
jgi:KamA family protein